MAKKSIWDIDLKKTSIALVIMIAFTSLILYGLQTLGAINVWTSWKDFFATQLSVYIFIVAVIIVAVLTYEIDEVKSAKTTETQQKNFKT